jgi:hypothetical protein
MPEDRGYRAWYSYERWRRRAKLRRLNIVPSDLAGDDEFLRRLTIDTIGSLPTPDEVRAFLADGRADKRQRKIDELLARPGQLTRRGPTASEQRDIEFGWSLAKEIGRLDIGQSVAVKGRAVIAVEAVEGTDACIRRAGEFCPQGGFTVVKVAKPQQDMRFDVPTIGLGTIESLIVANASLLAIEAGKTIVVDQAAVIALANQHGLAIVSLERP